MIITSAPLGPSRRHYANGAVLVVEYKGADRWSSAEDDRLIGNLWAELSGGRCRFVMVKDRQWDGVRELLPCA